MSIGVEVQWLSSSKANFVEALLKKHHQFMMRGYKGVELSTELLFKFRFEDRIKVLEPK